MGSNLPVPVPSQVPAKRRQVSWLDDDTAAYIDFREVSVAASLGFFTGGGGHIYNKRWLTGLGLSIASVAALVVGVSSFAPVLGVWAAIGIAGAVSAAKDAKTVNRFVLARNNSMRASGGRLATAMAAGQGQLPGVPSPEMAPAGAGPHQGLIDKFRQVAALRGQNMLNEAEYQDRKIDLLTQYTGASRDEIDQLLYALLPLVDEGTLGLDDIEFAKSLGQ